MLTLVGVERAFVQAIRHRSLLPAGAVYAAQDEVALAEQQIGFLEFLMALTHAVHAKYARRSPPLPLAEALDEAMQAMRCRLPISPKAEDPFLLGVLTPAARATLARSARELRAVFDTYSTAEAPTTVAAGDAGRALLTASDLIEVALCSNRG
jgi:hypothetical protein